GIESKTFAITQSRSVALRPREMLIFFVGVIKPGAGASLELGAWHMTRRTGHAVLDLARIGRRPEIDEEMAFVIDDEGMHRMIAGERQAGNNDLRIFRRRNAIGRQWIANNLVVLLGVEAAFADADTGASGGALRL